MAYITPPLYMVGAITLAAPFTNAVVPNLPYKLISIRSLTEIIHNGQNPFEQYYQLFNVSEEKYNQDVLAGVSILTFQASSGTLVEVPNSYLTSLPSAGGIPYTNYLVAVDLGLLPDSLDLAYFTSKVQQLAHDVMGMQNAETKIVAASDTIYMSQEDSKAVETARLAVMATVETDYALYLREKALRASAEQKIAILEKFITDNVAKLNA
jgi:hypothetical protein